MGRGKANTGGGCQQKADQLTEDLRQAPIDAALAILKLMDSPRLRTSDMARIIQLTIDQEEKAALVMVMEGEHVHAEQIRKLKGGGK